MNAKFHAIQTSASNAVHLTIYEKIGNNIKVHVGTKVVSTFLRHGVFTIIHKKM